MARRHGDLGGVVIAVHDEPRRDVRDLCAASDLRLPIALDRGGRVGAAFGVIGYPTYALLDEEGRLIEGPAS